MIKKNRNNINENQLMIFKYKNYKDLARIYVIKLIKNIEYTFSYDLTSFNPYNYYCWNSENYDFFITGNKLYIIKESQWQSDPDIYFTLDLIKEDAFEFFKKEIDKIKKEVSKFRIMTDDTYDNLVDFQKEMFKC